MTEPERLNRGGELERLLLDSVRDDDPPAGARARTMAALGAGTAVAVSSIAGGAAGVIAPKVLWGTTVVLAAKWLAIGAGTGIAALAVAHNVAPHLSSGGRAPHAAAAVLATPQPSRDSLVPTHREMPMLETGAASFVVAPANAPEGPSPGGVPSLAPKPSEPQRLPPVAVQPTGPLPEAPMHARVAVENVGSAPTPPAVFENVVIAPPAASAVSPLPAAFLASAPPSLLARQIATIDEARRALKSGDAANTVALLDAYAVAFPTGDLMPEATLLRIEALLKMGQRTAAEQVANAFLAHNPASAHSRRIRRLLDGAASH